jgi:signal transduction histidine kinase
VAPTLAVSGRAPPRRIPAGVGYAGAMILAALAGGMAAAGEPSDATAIGLARALIVGAPLVVGFYAWHTGRAARFGTLLMALGLAWFVAAFAESERGGWYAVGRAAGWSIEILFVYVALAFPRGRLEARADRLLVAAMVLVVALFYLPQLVLAERFQVPSPYTSCTGDCPANALFLLDSEPVTALGGLRAMGALLVFTIDLAVVSRLWRRMAESRSVTRSMLAPVAVVAAGRAALVGFAIVAREVAPESQGIEVVAWGLALATPAMALAFAVGIMRFQLFAGRVLQQLADFDPATHDVRDLERTLARAFADRSLRLVFPADGTQDLWADAAGRPVVLADAGARRSVIEVTDKGRVIAAIVCDEDLLLQPGLLRAAASFVAVTLDNRRLETDAARSLQELEASRARLVASAERERRRIERDLHDGAQQRLVALKIELELADELLGSDPEAARERLRQLERDVDEALEELRSLAHGVYPPVLADRGLAEAIRAVAARSPVRVDLEAHNVGRYASELESAVYYCVLEALQNALKHAKGVRRILVELEGDGEELRFAVRDDGAGMADRHASGGMGITGMRDRVAAFGGGLDVASAVGVGTTVRGVVRTVSPIGP